MIKEIKVSWLVINSNCNKVVPRVSEKRVALYFKIEAIQVGWWTRFNLRDSKVVSLNHIRRYLNSEAHVLAKRVIQNKNSMWLKADIDNCIKPN